MNKIGRLIAECEGICNHCEMCIYLSLQESMDKKKNLTGYWRIVGHNTNWMRQNGYMYKAAENAKKLIYACVNSYGDVSLTIKNYGTGFYMNAKHHDCPVNGTSFYCTPVSFKTFEEQPKVEV